MKKEWLALGSLLALSGCDGGGGDSTGISGSVSADLSWFAGDPDFDAGAVWFDTTLAVDLSFQDLPDGGCMALDQGIIDGGSVQLLDAGTELTMDGPAGDLTLTQDFFPGFYLASTSGTALYVPGGTYTFSGIGGADVGAFSQSVTAPSALTLTSPDVSSGSATISKAAGITLAWTSSGGTDPVFVYVDQTDENDATIASIVCRFDDDGSGTVPSSELSAFVTSASNPNGFNDFTVEKRHYVFFNAPGGGNTVASVGYIYNADADIQ